MKIFSILYFIYKLSANLGDVKGLIQEKSAPAMKDIKWYTYNATIGYLVSGKYIFQINLDIHYKSVGFLFIQFTKKLFERRKIKLIST